MATKGKEIPKKVFHKLSSKRDKTYTIAVYDDGKFWCDCMGFKFSRNGLHSCRHTRELGLA